MNGICSACIIATCPIYGYPVDFALLLCVPDYTVYTLRTCTTPGGKGDQSCYNDLPISKVVAYKSSDHK